MEKRWFKCPQVIDTNRLKAALIRSRDEYKFDASNTKLAQIPAFVRSRHIFGSSIHNGALNLADVKFGSVPFGEYDAIVIYEDRMDDSASRPLLYLKPDEVISGNGKPLRLKVENERRTLVRDYQTDRTSQQPRSWDAAACQVA